MQGPKPSLWESGLHFLHLLQWPVSKSHHLPPHSLLLCPWGYLIRGRKQTLSFWGMLGTWELFIKAAEAPPLSWKESTDPQDRGEAKGKVLLGSLAFRNPEVEGGVSA